MDPSVILPDWPIDLMIEQLNVSERPWGEYAIAKPEEVAIMTCGYDCGQSFVMGTVSKIVVTRLSDDESMGICYKCLKYTWLLEWLSTKNIKTAAIHGSVLCSDCHKVDPSRVAIFPILNDNGDWDYSTYKCFECTVNTFLGGSIKSANKN